MDVNDVKIVRRLKAGMADWVNVHADLAKALQQHRFGRYELFGARLASGQSKMPPTRQIFMPVQLL